jgi:SET and MYND domain-containing protein 4
MFEFHKHVPKHDEYAERFRICGNKCYQKRDFYGALECYNNSLCLAKSESNLALAYSNRSAVYFEVQEYQHCLENIRLARDHGCPFEKLKEREEKSQNLVKPETDESFFKLSYPANKKLPFVVDCLELCEDEKYGRHIITTKDLKPGDIIAMEETPFKSLTEDGTNIRCANCFKSNKMNLIPFDECISGKILFM